MNVISYSSRFNSRLNMPYLLNSCHMELRSDDSGFIATIVYDKLENYDKVYLEYISKMFKKTKFVSLEFKENNTLKFEIKAHNTVNQAVQSYACFCMLRFILTYNVTFKEWYELIKKYPKKNKFKLLLWLNQKHNHISGSFNIITFDYRSFYSTDLLNPIELSKSRFIIHEIMSFTDFLKKQFPDRRLNPHMAVVKVFNTKEEKLAELDKILKKL